MSIWRKIFAWEVAPESVPFAEFSRRVNVGDIWRLRNNEYQMEFYVWIKGILARSYDSVSYVGSSDNSLEDVLRHRGRGNAGLLTDRATVMEYVDNRPVPGGTTASLRWEVSREGPEEAPAVGKRVRMMDWVPDDERNYSGFTVQPGDTGTIVDPHPDVTHPLTIEILWDDYPSSGYVHSISGDVESEGHATGWYIDLTNIEYI